MTIEKIVGKNIEKHFKTSGLSITEFGKRIDTPNTTYVRKMFLGEVSIGIGKLHKVASTLEVTVLDLVEGSEKLDSVLSKRATQGDYVLTKEHKKQLRDRLLELIGTQDVWDANEEVHAEVKEIRKVLFGSKEIDKFVTNKQKQIIHMLLSQETTNAEVARKLNCSREYVASVRRGIKKNIYEDYLSNAYQDDVNILALHSNGLDKREIAFKLNLSEEEVKNALEELEWLL